MVVSSASLPQVFRSVLLCTPLRRRLHHRGPVVRPVAGHLQGPLRPDDTPYQNPLKPVLAFVNTGSFSALKQASSGIKKRHFF